MLPGASQKGNNFVTNTHTRVKAAGGRDASAALEPEVSGADDVPRQPLRFSTPSGRRDF